MTASARLGRVARRLGLVAAAAALAATVVALAVHLPWVQARVATWAFARLEAGGIRVRTRVLTFNLATRRVHAEGVVVSTTTDPQHPFLEADRLDVTLPRSVWSGRFGLTSLEGDRVRVVLIRRRDGSTNFPQDGSSGGSTVPSFPIASLVLPSVSVTWRDEALDMGATATALSVVLRPAAGGAGGAVTVAPAATFRMGERTTSFGASARVVWNGSRLSFDSLRVQAPEATLAASGAVALLGGNPSLVLDASGSADLDRLAAWFVVGDQPIGQVAFRAHATGSLADPVADVTLTSEDLSWQRLTGVAVTADMHVDRRALHSQRVMVRALGGTATARGSVSFSDTGERAQAAIDWRDVDVTRLLAALGEKAPVRIETMIDGRATASWAAWRLDAMTADVRATTRSAPSAPGGAAGLGFSGSVTLAARAAQWRGTIDQWADRAVHITGTAGGRLAAAALSSSTVSAAITAAADSLPELWSTLRALDLVGAAPPQTLTGSARADLTLSGGVGNPRLAGRIGASLPALDELRAYLQPNLWPAGGLTASATVSGTAANPVLDGQLTGGPLSLAGQRVDQADAAWNLTPQALRVDPLRLTQPGGRLTVTGRYDLRAGDIDAHLTAGSFVIAPIPGAQRGDVLVPLTARLSGDWRATGTLADPQGAGQLDLVETTAYGRNVGRVSMRLTQADHRLHAAIDAADLSTTGTGTLALGSPGAFVADVQTTDVDLAALASRLRVETSAPVTGVTSFSAHLEGVTENIAQARVTLDLQRLAASVGDVPVRATGPGRASYDGRTLDVSALALEIGASRFRAAGRLGADLPGTLAASLEGDARDLQQLVLTFLPAGSVPAGLQVDGRVRIDVRAPGVLDRPALSAEASVDAGRIAVADVPPATGLVARASYDGGVVSLSRFEAAWQAATVSATGTVPIALVAPGVPEWIAGAARVPAAAAHVQARFEAITPAVLAPFVPAATLSQLTGLVFGTITLDADRPELADVRGQLVLDHLTLAFAGVPFDQQRPTRIDVAGGRATAAVWDWGGPGNRFSVGGGVRFDGTPSLDLSVNGTIDLRALGALLPGAATGGTALVDARVTGPLADPQFGGHVDVQRGEWRIASPRIAVSDLAGRIELSRDQVTASNLTGQANGGTVVLAGVLHHARLRPTSGRLTITGRALAMAVPEALKTEVDLDLALVVAGEQLSLTGDAVVLGGSYRKPISLATGLLDVLRSPRTGVQLDAPSAVDAMALDIHLTTRDDIGVDNNYGRLALAANVGLGGTVAHPTVVGHVEAREGGRIFLGGNVYQIVGSGAIDFSDPSSIEPDLAITAVTRVSGYEVTLNLKGTPATLETTLTSDPPLTQGEIVSLLVTGQSQNANALAIGRDQALGYLSGELLGVSGRALGLDTLRVERGQDVRYDAGLVAGETDPSSRLTFGKQVTRQFEVIFSQSLRNTGKLTWIVGYRPRPNIELRAVSEDNTSRIYDFRHDVTIGGPPASTAPARGPSPRVGSVRFTGTPGLSTTALRESLHLTEGKAFDFFRWEDDRDRLEAAVRRENHFEGRVAARRSDAQGAAAASVDLIYDVTRGPRTIVDITGIPHDGELQAEIERLWEQAVFDGFLRDEAANAAGVRMARAGYLRAVVTTEIETREGGGESHLVVTIQPGPRSTSRRLVFSGHRHFSTTLLEALAVDRTLGASPWVDPEPFVNALTALYRNEGFLDAVVVVGPPAFDGAAATRPVVITEGPRFHLDAVAFTGARARSAAALAEAFPLRSGALLTRAAADEAVDALMRSYRADGFNAVRVTLTNVTSQAARASGLAAMTVDIDEGPRQVLRDVVVEGFRRTSPEVVTREFQHKIGQPVNLTAWAQSRKRLYDAGVFRQVDIQPVSIAETPTGSQPPVEQSIRARVTLVEWPPLRVRYGFELDETPTPASETRTLRPGLAADATYRNVFGRAASTGLALRYTKDFEAARSFLTTPRFFGLPLTSNLFLARSREHLGVSTNRPFVTDKSAFTAEQRFSAGRRLQIAYSYSFQRNHTFDANADPEDPFALDITIDVARLTATALLDTRDDLVEATRGRLVSVTFEYGAGALGSDLRFAKYFVQHNYYRAAGRGVVVATSGRLGLAAGYGQELILSERFYAGGGNSVRGFREGTLGAVDVFGDPAGGNALLVFNGEVRFPIVRYLRGVGFVDAGNAFAAIGDLSLRGLRAGSGVGLRVQTPFALLRVDLAAPLARRPGESRVRWFFSIGQAF